MRISDWSSDVCSSDLLAAARHDFLHVADGLFEQRARRREDDHRDRLVDQRDRAVLHLARRIAFGVDVADFLELERAFEGERIVGAAAEVEHIARGRSEKHTSELQSLMRISYAVFCLKKTNNKSHA